MRRKTIEIARFCNLLKRTFKSANFIVNDQWDDANAIGFQKDNKLIYVAFYSQDDYFYECSILTDGFGQSCKVCSNNATEEEMLRIIGNFFEIKRRD